MMCNESTKWVSSFQRLDKVYRVYVAPAEMVGSVYSVQSLQCSLRTEVLLIVFTLYLSLKGFPFALKSFNNLPNITLRNEKMIAMGYEREAIVQSVTNRAYDEIYATYMLLGTKEPEE